MLSEKLIWLTIVGIRPCLEDQLVIKILITIIMHSFGVVFFPNLTFPILCYDDQLKI